MGQGSLKRRQKRLNGYEQKKAKKEREKKLKRAMKLAKKGRGQERSNDPVERRRQYKEVITVAHKAAKRGITPYRKEKSELYTQIATAPPERKEEDKAVRYADYARKMGIAEHRELKKVRKILIRKQGMRCGICGLPISKMEDCTVDHIVPRYKGGKTTLGNCQLAHTLCNLLKDNNVSEKKLDN